MKQWCAVSALAGALAFTPGIIASQEKPTPPGARHDGGASADTNFVRTTAMDGLAAVEYGRLAATNAANEEVKAFAQRMVTDHAKANGELKTLASSKQIALPAELDPRHRATHDTLAKSTGAAFDRAYMLQMVQAHRLAVALFQREVQSGRDADIRAWAERLLPALEEHLKMATQLNGALAKGPR